MFITTLRREVELSTKSEAKSRSNTAGGCFQVLPLLQLHYPCHLVEA